MNGKKKFYSFREELSKELAFHCSSNKVLKKMFSTRERYCEEFIE
jgi:hypothetical protein